MSVAKIIVQGPSRSYKTTLAILIQEALQKHNICCAVHDNNDESLSTRVKNQQLKIDSLALSNKTVEIEVKQINREPKCFDNSIISDCMVSDFQGAQPVGEYDHLNVDCPVIIKQGEVEVRVSLPEVMRALIKANRGVHRACSFLDKHYQAKAAEENDYRYKNSSIKISKLVSLAAEHSTFI